MEPRIDYSQVAPEALQTYLNLELYVRRSGLEHRLLHLVKLRASQINGCAYCLDMHSKDARAAGEDEERLHTLAAWRETPFFTERERAALAWTEAVTKLGEGGIPDDLFDATREHFSESEIVDLTFAIVTINGWNRLSIAFRPTVGAYVPAAAVATPA